MQKSRLLFILLFSFICLPGLCQENMPLDSLLAKGDSYYNAKNYDSSLHYYLRSLKWFRENTPGEAEILVSPVVMLGAGRCYLRKKDLANAQKFMNYSLIQARATGVREDITNAFAELNDLHHYITAGDLPFTYPSIPVTEEVLMFFPVTKVERVSADSIRIRIGAGRLDGITDSVKRGSLISKYDADQKERPFGLVNCYIRECAANYCIAMATNDSARRVLEGDLVELRTRVPVSWRKLDVDQFLLYAINFTDNYRQPLFNSRYLYYYSDSLTNETIALSLKAQVDEIVSVFAEDTLLHPRYRVKADKGIFAGDNVMKALSGSNAEHLRLFMGFVNEFPRTYIGNPFKFSDVYANWILNNTSLAMADLRNFLIEQPGSAGRRKMANNLSADIRKNKLLDRWFNEGMQMASADNIDSAGYIADLIRDAALVLSDKFNRGWGIYLRGYIEKKLGNYARADSLFKLSLAEFRAGINPEGIDWASKALASLRSSHKITMNVQTGHLFPYLIAPSPNSKYLATGGNYDKFIKIWDLALGREVMSFTAHEDNINSLQYSPNGRYIVSASDDNTIKIWNAYDFSLVKTFHTKKPALSVIFTPDSRQLVTGSTDSLVRILDLNSGVTLKTFKKHRGSVTGLAFLPGSDRFFFSCGTDSMVYKWDLETNDWDHWYKEKGQIINISITGDGKYLSTLSTDTLIVIRNLQTHERYFTVRPNYSAEDNTDFAIPAFTPDSKYLAFSLNNDTLDMVELATLGERVYGFKKEGRSGLYDLVFTPDGNFLAGRINYGGPLRVFNFSGWDISNRPTINFKDLKNYYNLPTEVQFSGDDNKLFVVHEGVSSVDLRNGSTSFLYFGALGFQNNYILLNDGTTGLYSDTQLSFLKFYDFVNKKTTLSLHLPDPGEELTRYELSANNHFVFLAGKNNTVTGFALPSGDMLFSNRFESGQENGINAIRYDSLRQRLYIIGQGDEIIVADAKKGSIIGLIPARAPKTIEVGPLYLYVTCANSEVYKYEAAGLRLLKKIKVHGSGKECFGSVMSGDYRWLVVQVADKFVTLDTRTDKVLYEKYDHDYENGMMTISHDNRLLASGGFDCKVNLYDLASGGKIATIYTPRDKEFMIADNEGHYLAPKNSLEAVGFNYNNAHYGFEQFDSRFNRPDLVLQKIGRADSNLLRSFHAAYLRRLRKLRLTESDLSAEPHLPIVRLKDKFALKPATSLAEYELNIACYDAKYPLRSFQVMVNNNPLFGTAGWAIPGDPYRYEQSVKVPLSVGNNIIRVYCINRKGAISLSESIEINSSNKPATPSKTYFIGIAVSSYQDTSMNLRFAVKDVRDLAAMFDRLEKNYEVDTLIDAVATRENILRLREKLMHTTVNDKVIISVNGHGLLNDSLDFYYATYDIDFRNPAKRGLKYEDLEALLDGIPARKKLLLIDACHSGALDKEELIVRQKKDTLTINRTTGDTGTVIGIARGTIVVSSATKLDANSTYELMQQLFTDLSAGNGAVIISAAGGLEYAFESDTWNNGVFTYCIRKGIENELADKDGGNEDNFVDVAELKSYVSRKVMELTNGRQRPVSRRENIEFNWVIW